MGRLIRDPRLTDRGRSRQRAGYFLSNLATAHSLDRDGAIAGARQPWTRTLQQVGAALALVLVFLGWLWYAGAERRSIRQMPPDRRAALYAETFRAFETACIAPEPALIGHCREQASFLLAFDECDDHCRLLAVPLLRWRS